MLDWNWPETPIVIGITLLLAVALRWVLLRMIRRASSLAITRANQRSGGEADALYAARHAARAATLGSLLRSVTNAVIAVLATLTILDTLGVPLTPLLASAGVGGVALGFGAQSLVKDYLSGIFMIVEDQYGVGDTVDVGDVIGTVEDVGLRVTRLRDPGGQVWYVRNGEIVRVGNQSQGWSTAIVDVPVDSAENSARVIELLSGVTDEVYADEQWRPLLLEQPQVMGVQAVEAGRMTIRLLAKAKPTQAPAVQRALLDAAVRTLNEAGVRGPRLPTAAPPPM